MSRAELSCIKYATASEEISVMCDSFCPLRTVEGRMMALSRANQAYLELGRKIRQASTDEEFEEAKREFMNAKVAYERMCTKGNILNSN